tara:strand:- start:4660 stop:7245 length:2586 start_codon:yes stop_codon:yes gene_type:complete
MSAATKHENTLKSRSSTQLVSTMLALVLAISGCQSFYGPSTPPAPAVVGPGAVSIPSVDGIAPIAPPPSPSGPGAVPPPSPTPPEPPRFGLFDSVGRGGMADARLTLSPQSIVAPVGSEVVLLGGITNNQGKGAVSERIDWMLSPESVGEFMAVDKSPSCLLLRFPSNRPRKVTNNYAISSTTTARKAIGRGTATSQDNVVVERGQTWVTVSSPTDGVSYVTAFAPNVPAWDLRKQNATIYWVDAQFSFPAPAIAPIGERHTFTTVVTRLSDGSPLEGYVVRYRSTDANAVFAPAGNPMIELLTDAEGRASAEIYQPNPGRGITQIQMEVIRPAGRSSAADRRLEVGRGSTSMTWTAPGVSLDVTGPPSSSVGSQASFQVVVSNDGDMPLQDVVVSHRVPAPLEFVNSSIQAMRDRDTLQWNIGQLAAGQKETFVVDYKILSSGSARNCFSVTSAEQVQDQACIDLNTTEAQLELNVSGPTNAMVGEEVTYRISVSNRSQSPLAGLIVKNTFDEGLNHAVAASPIERDLGTLEPGQTRNDISVTFRATRVGNLCQTVEVIGSGAEVMTKQSICLTVEQQDRRPALKIEKRGPSTAQVGENIIFESLISNTGSAPLMNVTVIDTFEQGLEPTRVSDGYQIEEDQLTWKFAQIAPGQIERLQVEVRCKEAVRACSRVTVTADGDLVMADESCVQISQASVADPNVPPPITSPPSAGGSAAPGATSPPATSGPGDNADVGDVLALRVTDLRDEVPIGGTIVYEVTVTNPRSAPDANVVVIVTVPEGLAPTTGGVGIVAPSNPNIGQRVIRFNPVAEIRPGESLIYRIPIQAEQAGQFRSQIRVTSDGQRRPLIRTEDSSVFQDR